MGWGLGAGQRRGVRLKERGQAQEEDQVKVTGLVNVWVGAWGLGKEQGSGSRGRPGKSHRTGKCMGWGLGAGQRRGVRL